jgi:hypothetical protein
VRAGESEDEDEDEEEGEKEEADVEEVGSVTMSAPMVHSRATV